MGTYFLYTGNEHATTAFAFGDLEEISYIARRRIAEMNGKDGQVTVKLLELKSAAYFAHLEERGENGEQSVPPTDAIKREVTAFTGDQDTAALVLKRRLAAERAEAKASGAYSEQTTPDVDPSV